MFGTPGRLATPCVALALLAASLGSAFAADETRLVQAIKARNRAAVASLAKDRAAVTRTQADGSTPLHWAVYVDDVEIVDALRARDPDRAARTVRSVQSQLLVRDPEERIFFRGRWYEGLYLQAGASPDDLAQFARFQAEGWQEG